MHAAAASSSSAPAAASSSSSSFSSLPLEQRAVILEVRKQLLDLGMRHDLIQLQYLSKNARSANQLLNAVMNDTSSSTSSSSCEELPPYTAAELAHEREQLAIQDDAMKVEHLRRLAEIGENTTMLSEDQDEDAISAIIPPSHAVANDLTDKMKQIQALRDVTTADAALASGWGGDSNTMADIDAIEEENIQRAITRSLSETDGSDRAAAASSAAASSSAAAASSSHHAAAASSHSRHGHAAVSSAASSVAAAASYIPIDSPPSPVLPPAAVPSYQPPGRKYDNPLYVKYPHQSHTSNSILPKEPYNGSSSHEKRVKRQKQQMTVLNATLNQPAFTSAPAVAPKETATGLFALIEQQEVQTQQVLANSVTAGADSGVRHVLEASADTEMKDQPPLSSHHHAQKSKHRASGGNRTAAASSSSSTNKKTKRSQSPSMASASSRSPRETEELRAKLLREAVQMKQNGGVLSPTAAAASSSIASLSNSNGHDKKRKVKGDENQLRQEADSPAVTSSSGSANKRSRMNSPSFSSLPPPSAFSPAILSPLVPPKLPLASNSPLITTARSPKLISSPQPFVPPMLPHSKHLPTVAAAAFSSMHPPSSLHAPTHADSDPNMPPLEPYRFSSTPPSNRITAAPAPATTTARDPEYSDHDDDCLILSVSHSQSDEESSRLIEEKHNTVTVKTEQPSVTKEADDLDEDDGDDEDEEDEDATDDEDGTNTSKKSPKPTKEKQIPIELIDEKDEKNVTSPSNELRIRQDSRGGIMIEMEDSDEEDAEKDSYKSKSKSPARAPSISSVAAAVASSSTNSVASSTSAPSASATNAAIPTAVTPAAPKRPIDPRLARLSMTPFCPLFDQAQTSVHPSDPKITALKTMRAIQSAPLHVLIVRKKSIWSELYELDKQMERADSMPPGEQLDAYFEKMQIQTDNLNKEDDRIDDELDARKKKEHKWKAQKRAFKEWQREFEFDDEEVEETKSGEAVKDASITSPKAGAASSDAMEIDEKTDDEGAENEEEDSDYDSDDTSDSDSFASEDNTIADTAALDVNTDAPLPAFEGHKYLKSSVEKLEAEWNARDPLAAAAAAAASSSSTPAIPVLSALHGAHASSANHTPASSTAAAASSSSTNNATATSAPTSAPAHQPPVRRRIVPTQAPTAAPTPSATSNHAPTAASSSAAPTSASTITSPLGGSVVPPRVVSPISAPHLPSARVLSPITMLRPMTPIHAPTTSTPADAIPTLVPIKLEQTTNHAVSSATSKPHSKDDIIDLCDED